MNFDLSEEQRMLIDSCDRWQRERCTIDARRAQAKADAAVVPATWRELVDLGLSALLVPEGNGGLARPLIDAVLVAQVLGRGWLLDPFIDSAIAAAVTLSRCDASPERDASLAGLAEGAIVIPLRDVRADGTRLRGWAPHASYADVILAALDERIYEVHARDCDRRVYRQLDGSAAAEVEFDAGAAVLAEGGVAHNAWQAGADAARIGRIAEGIGLAKTVLDLTAEYLRTRKQFGQPIGRFQALAHRMADLAVLYEQAQSLMLAAAMRMDARTLDAAQALAHRALRTIAQQSIQLHGGIGMTQEYALSSYAKRMFAIEVELGDAETALARFAAGYAHA
ncbi:MAG: acyl-CoA dehydrogenase family protein [Gemmatimonadota bacterium]